MITDADMIRLAEIRCRTAIGNPQDPADPADRAFLIDLVDRLSREKPDDFKFPAYAALVNDQSQKAYAMRLDRRVQRESTLLLSGTAPLPIDAFRQEVSCDVTDAEMLVRPYVRLIEPQEERIIEQLSVGTLSLLVDDHVVLDHFPLRDFLGALDGYGVRRRPFSMSGFLSLNGPLFRACSLEPSPPPHDQAIGPGHEVALSFATISEGWNANGGREYGLMLPRQSVIQIRLGGLGDLREPWRLAVGTVSALYSTKHKILRKQDWSPRDQGGSV